MKRIIVLATTAALGAAAMPALASDVSGMTYVIFPRVEAVGLDSERDFKDEIQLGVGAGYGISRNWAVELNATRSQHGHVGNPDFDMDLTGISISALRIFAADSKVSPFVSLGYGALLRKFTGYSSDHESMLEAGLGALVDLSVREDGSRKLQLRPEMRVRYDFDKDNGYADKIFGLSLQYAFGPARAAPPPPPPPRAVEPPPPPRAVEPPPPPPPPLPPGDADKDGVTDDKDRCPSSPKGAVVDEHGCTTSYVLRGMLFEFDSSELTAEARGLLDGMHADLQTMPAELQLEIRGHTDSRGSDAYNQKLSERRARAVRDYLAAKGVAGSRMTMKGFGESNPVASNDTDEGRHSNRRVTIELSR